VTSESGRATIMMPHPERVFRTVSNSWHPENWGEDSPWMRIFRNARKQLGKSFRTSPRPAGAFLFVRRKVSGIATNLMVSPKGDI
jgi:hypothetical protein